MTNSTNKCCRSCILHPKNNDELDYQPGVRCGNPSCICHHPVTQSKEWGERFDKQFSFFWTAESIQKSMGSENANVKEFIRQTLRTELESLLQEMGDECDIECKGHEFGGKKFKLSPCHECGFRTTREVIKRKIENL